MMYLVDQSKPCAQICLPKYCMLHKFVTTNSKKCQKANVLANMIEKIVDLNIQMFLKG